MKILTAALLGITFTLALTACNTMEGVGQDMEDAGEAVEDSAQDNKNY